MIALGRLTLKNPLVLAPMAGYTDLPFRILCSEHGAAFTYTELISIEGVVRNHAKTHEMMRIADAERPVAIQLFGKDPQHFAQAARIAEELNPDCIDINMGCCAKKVCGPGSGSGLLRDLPLLARITEATVKAVSIPVSAKIRLGYTDSTKNYREVARILQECGVNHIAVHGRTTSQQYTGKSDWDAIAEVASLLSIPVIGSGDICSYSDAIKKISESGCAAVMIGRCAVGNPWIFSEKTPDLPEIAATARKHLEMMIEYYGNYGLVLARKHLVKYLHGFRNAGHLRGMFASSTSPEWAIGMLTTLEKNSDEYR